MDIIFGDELKKELRAIMWVLKRKLKKDYKVTMDMVRDDMDNCGNPVIAKIWNEIKVAADKIQESYQKEIATDFPMVILWVIYKDTAYSPIFFYIMVKLFETPTLLESAKKFYVEPENWYVNRWNNTKENTKRLKEEGKLSYLDGDLANDEKIFVPLLQEKRIEEEIKKIKEEMKK